MAARIIFISSLLVLSSCGIHPISQRTLKVKNAFTDENILNLRFGMSESEVKRMFGEPSRRYGRVYNHDGKRVAVTILRYQIATDRNFRYVERWKQNTFIFHNSYDDQGLVFWEVQEDARETK